MSCVDIQCADVSKHQHLEPKPSARPVFTPIGPSISYVELTQGQWALIDSDDAALVGQWSWMAQWAPNTKSFYARRSSHRNTVGMQKLLLKPASGILCDHISGNTLDNRRANLRYATPKQNSTNRRIVATNTSGYPGVSPRSYGKWQANITANGSRIYLGQFDTPELAYAARLEASEKLHGKFRRVA